MKLSAVPKKSLAAAACAAPSLLWSLWIFFSAAWFTIWDGLPFINVNPVLSIKHVLDLLALLTGIALFAWLFIPNNSRYRTGLKVGLGLIIAQGVISKVMAIAFFQVGAGQTVLSWLTLLLGADAILLFGALAKKSTEKLAALAMAVWYLWAFSQNMTQYWIPMGRDPDIAGGALAYMIVHSIATSVLPALLWAAALWLHPVLTRAMLEKTMIEEGQAHE